MVGIVPFTKITMDGIDAAFIAEGGGSRGGNVLMAKKVEARGLWKREVRELVRRWWFWNWDDDAGGWDWDGVVECFEIKNSLLVRKFAFSIVLAVYYIRLEIQEALMVKQYPSYRP